MALSTTLPFNLSNSKLKAPNYLEFKADQLNLYKSLLAIEMLLANKCLGIGDALQFRLLFDDLKAKFGTLSVALPSKLHPVVADHPALDRLIDCKDIGSEPCIDLTDVAYRQEYAAAPRSMLSRPEIWAAACKIELRAEPQMRIALSAAELARGVEAKGRILIAPISAYPSKSLMPVQLRWLIGWLRLHSIPFSCLHSTPVDSFPTLSPSNLRDWLSLIANCRAVVSVDTSAWHAAAGLEKKFLVIGTWCDAQVYAKHYRGEFAIVQKRMSCGPCGFRFSSCLLSRERLKPCLTEISQSEIETGLRLIVK